MRNWLLGAVLALGAPGCCGGPAPQPIQDAVQHELEDLLRIDAEVVPLLSDAVVEDTARSLQATWRLRVRAMALRVLTLLAWAKDEPIDVGAAHAKLFATLEGAGHEPE